VTATPRPALALLALLLGSVDPARAGGPAPLSHAPNVPPPNQRAAPDTLILALTTTRRSLEVAPGVTYEFWTFDDTVPGPFIRVRVGDTLEVHLTNADGTGMPHNIDLHAVTGPGGGAAVTTTGLGQEKVGRFRLLHPGLYVYHCAAPLVADHVANGMYGLILVEPRRGLPPVDREYYVMQSEIYASAPIGGQAQYAPADARDEHPRYIVFNGRSGSLSGSEVLQASTGEMVRLYVGNAGPNLVSSFHVIGEIFDRVYREGDVLSRPARSVQTTLVPAGGATIVDFRVDVPGTYTLVDHALFRTQKGAVGALVVTGPAAPDIYDPPAPDGVAGHAGH
jgi:nitrite reductase (NO-forming)